MKYMNVMYVQIDLFIFNKVMYFKNTVQITYKSIDTVVNIILYCTKINIFYNIDFHKIMVTLDLFKKLFHLKPFPLQQSYEL